ncbi:hypothetical protein DY000_02000235 [Brassica cretica]|uniref:Alfin N-terminal domain-containing protein n=1 Tax=Brassica cretica TaxID=69181 RepID=A0ABQ7CJZ4_BRACR|nr:hypothetical protein DY000_02000235 [Brassica cretica]
MFRRVVPSSSSAQNGDMHRRVPSSSPLISDDYIPRTVEHIFINYRLRRVGLLRAFGTDAGTLYNLCDPGNINSIHSSVPLCYHVNLYLGWFLC